MCRIRSVTTDFLKVTECFLCRTEWMPSRSERQIQHNASLSSEHFAVGLNMWPWFRWMSTSHLYSSNLRLLTETSACTTAPTRSLALPPLLSQPTVLIMQLRQASKGKAARETAGAREIYSHSGNAYSQTIAELLIPAPAPWRSVRLGRGDHRPPQYLTQAI